MRSFPVPWRVGRRDAGRAGAPVLPVLAAVAGALSWLGACSGTRPPEGLTPQQLFEWAQEKFEGGDHGAAVAGFQRFVIRDPLNPLVDSAQYLVGEAYLRDGQELLAATEFERLATTRPNSPLADDAQFGLCRAHWEMSPGLALEQEDTRRAAEECQRLLQFFPDSPLLEEARRILDEARAKLAHKAYRIGRYYFRNQLYESANIYFEKALEEGPDAPIVPDVLAALYRSYRRVGFDAEAEAVRRRLLQEYPDTPQARELREADGSDGT